MFNFMEIETNNPKLTQKQLPKEMGVSDWTIKRYKNDINMDNPYNRNNTKRKRTLKDLDPMKYEGRFR